MRNILYTVVVIGGALYLGMLHAVEPIKTLEGVSIFAKKVLSYSADQAKERSDFMESTIKKTATNNDISKEMRAAILDKIETELSGKIACIIDFTRPNIKNILDQKIYSKQEELGKALLLANTSKDQSKIVSNYDLDSILRAIDFIEFSENIINSQKIKNTFFPLLKKIGLGGYISGRGQ